jgi:hypothetical protein
MKLRGNFYYHHKNTNQNLGRAKIFAMLRLTMSYLFFLAQTDKTGANPFGIEIQKTTAMPQHRPASHQVIECGLKVVTVAVDPLDRLPPPMVARIKKQQPQGFSP